MEDLNNWILQRYQESAEDLEWIQMTSPQVVAEMVEMVLLRHQEDVVRILVVLQMSKDIRNHVVSVLWRIILMGV